MSRTPKMEGPPCAALNFLFWKGVKVTLIELIESTRDEGDSYIMTSVPIYMTKFAHLSPVHHDTEQFP